MTSRTVCGPSTAPVAAVFLVSETTMAARLTTAKAKAGAAAIPDRALGRRSCPLVWTPLTVVHFHWPVTPCISDQSLESSSRARVWLVS